MPNKKPINVAFLYDDSLDGSEGVTQYVKTLGGWLEAQGHGVSYLVGETKAESWQKGKVYSLAKNLKVVFNGNRLSIPYPAKKNDIRLALRQANPDILHVQMPHSPFMSQKVLNRAKGTPAVGTFHIYPANSLASLGSRLLKLLYLGGLSRIDEVVSVSSAAQSFAKRNFGLNSSVVPNMVDLSRYKQAKVVRQPQQIVFIGRLVKRKGCQHLLKAFAEVNREIPSSRLIIGGDGPERISLQQLVKKLGLSSVVEFKGYVPEDEKPDLLASSAIACFPSLYGESFGIVLIEAMAAGTGVVLAGNNPGYLSVMGSVSEAMFEPKNTSELAAKLIHFLKNEQSAEQTHDKQSSLVKKFDVAQVGPQIEELYKRAIANHR